jgi:hypothetical protein
MRFQAGGSLDEGKGTQTWSHGDGTEFQVRCGPNYKKHGKKEPSSRCFYELVGTRLLALPLLHVVGSSAFLHSHVLFNLGVDTFDAPRIMEGVASCVQLPDPPTGTLSLPMKQRG